MSRNLSFMFAIAAVSALPVGCGESAPPASPTGPPDEAIAEVYAGKLTVAQAQDRTGLRLAVVPVGGTVFHFGLDLSQSPPVPFPASRACFAYTGDAIRTYTLPKRRWMIRPDLSSSRALSFTFWPPASSFV